jgi:hypothetical protein
MSMASGRNSREASIIPSRKMPKPPSVARKITIGLTIDLRSGAFV